MTSHRCAWRLCVVLCLFVSAACDSGSPAPVGRPNLLLISVDTLRADRLGAYGYHAAKTPAADGLAASGVRFAEAATPIPRTTQAFASLFTSRAPRSHGLREVGERLNASERTLAEILRDAGYRTLAVSGNSVADRAQGLDQGFEHFVGAAELMQRAVKERSRATSIGGAERITLAALDLLGEVGGAPYFLWVHYKDPHWVYKPPEAYLSGDDAAGFEFFERSAHWKPRLATVFFNLNGEAERWRSRLARLYDAEIRYVDAMIARLLDAAGSRGGDAPTLVVFTSDHGESLGEHGYYFEHGALVYEATLRVPLIFSMPGRLPAGRVIDVPVSLVDLLPTTLTLMGVDPGPGHVFEGRDLSALMTGELAEADFPQRALFAESGSAMLPQNPLRELGGRRSGDEAFRYIRRGPWLLTRTQGRARLFRVEDDVELRSDVSQRFPEVAEELAAALDRVPPLADRWQSVRDGRWKLIRIPQSDGLRYELYDLSTDPLEADERSASEPAVTERLKATLESHLAEAPRVQPSQKRSAQEQQQVDERLRALGYIE